MGGTPVDLIVLNHFPLLHHSMFPMSTGVKVILETASGVASEK